MPDDMREVEIEKYRLLLVDDDAGWCVRPIAKLRANGFEVEYEEMAENTLSKIRLFKPHVVLLDVLFGNENKGKPTFGKIKKKYPDLPVIMLTSTMKDTFSLKDYPGCAFPYAKDQLRSGTDDVYREFADKIKRAIENSRLTEESLKKLFNFVIGKTDAMKNICSDILKVAPTEATVLITGESGTGKKLVAKAIHEKSNRADKQFESINCPDFPDENLLKSILFGHEKGAFTGATELRNGIFEVADGGTVFLDEIGDASREVQASLLKVLEDKTIKRVSGQNDIKVDVRIITATNKNLQEEIKRGTFREDLFYRLNGFSISLPPLRARKEDIPELLEHFIKKYNKILRKNILIETEDGKRDYLRNDVLNILRTRNWTGNIRDFENAVMRAMINAGDGNVLLPEHFNIQNESKTSSTSPSPEEASEKIFKKELSYEGVLETYRRDSKEMRKMVETLIDKITDSGGEISQGILANYLQTDVSTVKQLLAEKKDKKTGNIILEKISLVEKKKANKKSKKG